MKKINMNLAVIFDMDGVIIDSHSIAFDLLIETANQFGVTLSIDEIKTWGSLSSRQFWLIVKDKYCLPKSVEFYVNQYDDQEEVGRYNKLGPIIGIPELIKLLKLNNIKLALATSASKLRMNAVVDMFNLRDFFDCLLCDEDVIESKPNPQIFLKSAEYLGVTPELCVVVEDSTNGLIAAKRAGMKTVGYSGSDHVNEDLTIADIIISKFSDLSTDIIKDL